MINDISTINFNMELSTTKQKTIDLLSTEWPLSAKKIHERLQKLYALEISYQGVHKTLQEMIEEKIIKKNGNNYLLSIEWIQNTRKMLENVERTYLQNTKITIPKDIQSSIVLEFDSFTEMCVSTAELLLSRQLAKGTNDKTFICTLEYGWWTIKFRFEHMKLLYDMCRVNLNPKNIIRTKTPFGEWIRSQYVATGGVSAPIGTKVDLNEDVFIQGDFIIEVTFTEEAKKIIEHYYNKWKGLNDSLLEFGIKDEPKIHATMRITKNPEMANYLKRQLNKVFEKTEN
ncbi:MAG: hypothetical protein Q7R70_05570 [Candidatus Diapherotrites archaeon]|nr:hypothetical protein [Candidatus Diapherotrites archaeon]